MLDVHVEMGTSEVIEKQPTILSSCLFDGMTCRDITGCVTTRSSIYKLDPICNIRCRV